MHSKGKEGGPGMVGKKWQYYHTEKSNERKRISLRTLSSHKKAFAQNKTAAVFRVRIKLYICALTSKFSNYQVLLRDLNHHER